VIARQGCKQIFAWGRNVHPGQLLNLSRCFRIAIDLNSVQIGDHGLPDLVGSCRREPAQKSRGRDANTAGKLLLYLSRKRSERILVWVNLATGLHEGGSAALAHEQHAPLTVTDDRRSNPNR
jgi:hypothetical protein